MGSIRSASIWPPQRGGPRVCGGGMVAGRLILRVRRTPCMRGHRPAARLKPGRRRGRGSSASLSESTYCWWRTPRPSSVGLARSRNAAFAFLTAPWPRWVTPFDWCRMFSVYFPLGCDLRAGDATALAGSPGILVALIAGAALSVRSRRRRASCRHGFRRLDVLANTAGALVGGVVGSLLGPPVPGDGAAQTPARTRLLPAPRPSWGWCWRYGSSRNSTHEPLSAPETARPSYRRSRAAHAPDCSFSIEAFTAAGT